MYFLGGHLSHGHTQCCPLVSRFNRARRGKLTRREHRPLSRCIELASLACSQRVPRWIALCPCLQRRRPNRRLQRQRRPYMHCHLRQVLGLMMRRCFAVSRSLKMMFSTDRLPFERPPLTVGGVILGLPMRWRGVLGCVSRNPDLTLLPLIDPGSLRK